jgi:tRNA threonylcarbamoyladenosine biosynthesis protein TsaB
VIPLILAVDTTHEYGSLTLARGAEILEDIAIHAPGGFAHILYGHLESLLSRHGVRLEAMDCFAAASGPGSFTGVRVGLACIKGLAEAVGKPAVAISNLEAIATFGTARLRAAVLDARRGEIYGALYDDRGGLHGSEVVSKIEPWFATLPPGDLEFVSPDPAWLATALAGTRFERAPIVESPRALGTAVARLAADRLLRGEAGDPAALDANYVRRSDAELFWKE